jgi:lysyl endopeptidase
MLCSIKYGLLSALLMVPAIRDTQGQLCVPGKPLGDFRRMKAADVIYLLPPPDPLEIDAGMQANRERNVKTLQFALERRVDLSPESNGAWEEVEGWRVWRVHLISPGARSLGLIFDRFRLREGVRLMVYDPGQEQVKGAYSARNNKSSGIFAVGHLAGEEAIIELQVPPGSDAYGELYLGSVSHAFLDPHAKGETGWCPGAFGCSEDCEIDVNCLEGADWRMEKGSVVRISTPTQYCTGVLLNNTSYNGDPLLLTAKHCIDRPAVAQGTVFEFRYESPSCFGGDGTLEYSISGAQSLAIGDSIDFSLVRLSVPPPSSFEAYYAGWDLSGEQRSGSTTIHHPEGDVKKISFDFRPPSSTASPSDVDPEFADYLYDSFWWIRKWDIGSTEPGSSGSPLFNGQKKVIGILSWGAARCGDSTGYDPVAGRIIFDKTVNEDDFYTKLNVAWDHNEENILSLRPWLDPGGTGQNSLEGYNPLASGPQAIAPDLQFRIYPNPAGSVLCVSRTGPGSAEVRYSIYDAGGALRLSGSESMRETLWIRLGLEDPGLYFICLETGGCSEIHKFVIIP